MMRDRNPEKTGSWILDPEFLRLLLDFLQPHLTREVLMRPRMWTVFGLLVLLAGLLVMGGCAGSTISVGDEPYHRGHGDRGYEGPGRGKGPPPWAPAHGYRDKHRYRYYPSAEVYFDLGRELYYYFSGGGWHGSVRLPRSIRAELEDYVILNMDAARPYEYHPSVRQRYPPGLSRGKGKGRKKGPWD